MSTIQKSLLAIVIFGIICFGGLYAKDLIPSLGSISAPDISKEAQAHILYGDSHGGGHKYGTSKNCKSEFPKSWSDAEIIDNIKKVAANDNLKWRKQGNGYYSANGKIDGIKMRVVLDKERDDVVTAYPLNTKRNSCGTGASAKSAKTVPAPEAVTPAAGTTKNWHSR